MADSARCLLLEHLQAVSNDLVQAITLINLKHKEAYNDLNSILQSLVFLYDEENIQKLYSYEEAVEYLIPTSKSWKSEKQGDLRQKISTIYNIPRTGATLSSESLMTLCLLYFTNGVIENQDNCRKKLERVLQLLCREAKYSQFIIWCLLEIVEKTNEEWLKQETSSQFMRRGYMNSYFGIQRMEDETPLLSWLLSIPHRHRKMFKLSQTLTIQPSICATIIINFSILDLLSKIGTNFAGNILAKPAITDIFGMIQNLSKIQSFEKSEHFEDSLFGKLMNLFESPVIIGDDRMIKRLVRVASGFIKYVPEVKIMDCIPSYIPIIGRHICARAESLEDILGGFNLLAGLLPIFPEMPSKSITKIGLIAIQKIGPDLLSLFEEYLDEHFLSPDELQSIQTILLDAIRTLVRVSSSNLDHSDIDRLSFLNPLWSSLSQILHISTNFEVLSLFQPTILSFLIVQTLRNDIEQLEEFTEHHSSHLNIILKNSDDIKSNGEMFILLVQYDNVLDFDVKLKYYQLESINMDERSKSIFLEECLSHVDTTAIEPILGRTVESLFVEASIDSSLVIRLSKKYKTELLHIARFPGNSGRLLSVLKKVPDFIENVPEHVPKVVEHLTELSLWKLLSQLLKTYDNNSEEQKIEIVWNIKLLFEELSFKKDTDKDLEDFIAYHKKTLNTILCENPSELWLFDILSSCDDILEVDAQLIYLDLILEYTDENQLWSTLSSFLHHYALSPEDLISPIFEVFLKITENDSVEVDEKLYEFLDKHKVVFNYFLLKTSDMPEGGSIFSRLSLFPWQMDFEVKIKHLKNGTFMEKECYIELLKECFARVEKGKNIVSELAEPIALLILALKDSEYLHEEAANHQDTINDVLRLNVSSKWNQKLYHVFEKNWESLDFDVRLKYYQADLTDLDEGAQTALMREVLLYLTTARTTEKINGLLHCADKLLGSLAAYDADISTFITKIEKYAVNRVQQINNFFTTTPHDNYILNILCKNPDLLTFKTKMTFIEVIVGSMEEHGLIDLLEECLTKLKKGSLKCQDVVKHAALLFKTIRSTADIYDLLETYKTEVNNLLRQHLGTKGAEDFYAVFQKQTKYLDFNVRMNYYQKDLAIMNEVARITLLTESLKRLNISKGIVAFEILNVIEKLISSFKSSEQDMSLFKLGLSRFGESNRKLVDQYFSGTNNSIEIFKILSDIPSFEIRMKYGEAHGKSLGSSYMSNLLSECMTRIEDEQDTVASLSEPIFKLLGAPGQNAPLLELAEKHRAAMNSILRGNRPSKHAQKLFQHLFDKNQGLLDFDVKCDYYQIRITRAKSQSLLTFLEECVKNLEDSEDYDEQLQLLDHVQTILPYLGYFPFKLDELKARIAAITKKLKC